MGQHDVKKSKAKSLCTASTVTGLEDAAAGALRASNFVVLEDVEDAQRQRYFVFRLAPYLYILLLRYLNIS